MPSLASNPCPFDRLPDELLLDILTCAISECGDKTNWLLPSLAICLVNRRFCRISIPLVYQNWDPNVLISHWKPLENVLSQHEALRSVQSVSCRLPQSDSVQYRRSTFRIRSHIRTRQRSPPVAIAPRPPGCAPRQAEEEQEDHDLSIISRVPVSQHIKCHDSFGLMITLFLTSSIRCLEILHPVSLFPGYEIALIEPQESPPWFQLITSCLPPGGLPTLNHFNNLEYVAVDMLGVCSTDAWGLFLLPALKSVHFHDWKYKNLDISDSFKRLASSSSIESLMFTCCSIPATGVCAMIGACQRLLKFSFDRVEGYDWMVQTGLALKKHSETLELLSPYGTSGLARDYDTYRDWAATTYPISSFPALKLTCYGRSVDDRTVTSDIHLGDNFKPPNSLRTLSVHVRNSDAHFVHGFINDIYKERKRYKKLRAIQVIALVADDLCTEQLSEFVDLFKDCGVRFKIVV
ncbi:hypothetical protein BS50DRAFT_682115 [Corynespora cassiicola Philippines]|uniref:F-box domain-containing protein n=1 Tax=Corynespora cassiicola Philippines TaxID=1448308 RepID=A0A2T2N3K7_CORCC|nr:hypothetical protein BS50DRAFT_682115 [Corynespora cassiicola Philippines]